MAGTRWTEQEDQIIKDNYLKMTWKEMERLLPGRNCEMIRYRANKQLKIVRNDKSRHTGKGKEKARRTGVGHISYSERNTIKEFGPTYPMVDLRLLMPRRSVAEIKEIADYLGVSLSGR